MAENLPNPSNASLQALAELSQATERARVVGNRNTVTDSAVNILDTLQSLGTLALSPLPGVELANTTSNSQFLDEFRSPGYLAARELNQTNNDPNAGFVDSAIDAAADAVAGGNLIADLSSQTPYLAMGPVSRLAGISRVEKMTGITGKLAQLGLGTNTPAVVNRVAALSGAVEGAGAYAQTYDRALQQFGDEGVARDQALKAGAFSAVVGAALGRLTPAFELDPTGRLGGNLAGHISAITGEAVVEEGGLAIAQTVADNVLAGKDPMENVGSQFGEALAISGVFTGGVRTPDAVLDVAKEVGRGVRQGITALADKAITPEQAAVNTAATEIETAQTTAAPGFSDPTVSAEPEVAPTVEVSREVGIRTVPENQGLEGDALEEALNFAIAAEEPTDGTDATAPTISEPTADDSLGETESRGSESTETVDVETVSTPSESVEPTARQVDFKSDSKDIRAILINAANDALIDSRSGAVQTEAIARKEALAPTVQEAQKAVEAIPDARVAEYVEAAAAGNVEAARRVEAVKRTDISKLPEEAVPETLKPVVTKLKELKDLKLNQTSNEILQRGFNGAKDSRGIRGYVQDVVNFGLINPSKPNDASKNLNRFVAHLQARAAAFKEALAKAKETGVSTDVEGTQTRNERGQLAAKPFVIWTKDGKVNPNTEAVVNRVLEDVARAQEALEAVKQSFPGMFEGETLAQPIEPITTPAAAVRVQAVPSNEDAETATVEAVVEPKEKTKSVKKVKPKEATGIRKKDGTPYATKGAANSAITKMKLNDVEAVEIDGGWEIRPAAKPIVAEQPAPVPTETIDPTESVRATAEELDKQRSLQNEAVPEVVEQSVTSEESIANPLATETDWVSTEFNTAFKIDSATTIESLLTSLSNDDKQRLRNGAANVIKDLNKTFARGIDKISPQLAKALKAPWGVFTHALVKKGNKLEVQQQLRQAFAIAATIHLYRAPNKYDATNLIVEGEVNRAATPHAWAREIARDAALLLGIKPDTTQSETLTQGLMLSLGLSTVQALIDSKDVSLEKLELAEGKAVNIIVPTAELSKLAASQLGFVDRVMEAINGPREYTSSLTPSEVVPEKVNHSEVDISESQKTALLNRQKVPHYLNLALVDFIQKIGKPGLKRLLTGAVSRKDMPPAVRELLEAQESGIDLELTAGNYYSDQILNDAATALYWEYGISINGRSVSNLGPQSYTLIRDLFSSAKATLDLNNQQHLNALKMTIAQALGAKTDVQSPEAVLAKYEELVVQWGDKAKSLLDAPEKTSLILERGSPYTPRQLNGLLTLGKLLTHDVATPFESFLPFEIDGKTNGAFNAEMFYGLGTIAPKNLEQAGLFLNKEDTTWDKELPGIVDKYGSKDLYERVARTALPILRKNWAELLKKFPGLKNSLGDNEMLLKLSNMLSSKDSTFTREGAKAASNPIVYGAGVGGVANQLVKDMKANLVSEWLRLDFALNKDPTNKALRIERDRYAYWLEADEKIWGYTTTAAAKALLEAYKIEKPTVSDVTALMVQITNLGYAVKYAQWQSQHNTALAKESRNEGIPDTRVGANGKVATISKWALSRKAYQRILRNTLSMTFSTAANDVGISLNDSQNAPDAFRVSGLGTSLQAPLDLPQVEPPRVRVLALLTQAAGDGAMVNEFLQEFRAITDVFDGIEFKVTDFFEDGKALNEAVWKTTQHDVLKDFTTVISRIQKAIESLTEAQKESVVEAYNSTIPNPELHLQGFEAFLTRVKNSAKWINIHHEEQLKGLAELNTKPNTVLQMGGGKGFTTPVQARESAAVDFRENWDTKVETFFNVSGNRLDKAGVVALMDSIKWKNNIQRFVWKRIRNLLPAGVNITLANNQAEWDALDTGRVYGKVDGVAFADGSVVMATTSPDIMLHELIHTVFSNTLTQYFSNINLVPTEFRQPINDLVQLLDRFKKFNTGSETAIVQGVIATLEAKGDRAGAVDEMLTYVISNKELIDELSPNFFIRVITRAKQILWGLFGKAVPATFLDDVLNSFKQLASSPLVYTNTDQVIRDHVNIDPIKTRTDSIYASMRERLIKTPHFKVPEVAESHLDKIQDTFNFSVDQQQMYARVWTLLRLDNRSAEMERFVSTVMATHPQATVFNGAKDVVASVMALAAVDPTFRTQIDVIWQAKQTNEVTADSLINVALNGTAIVNAEQLLITALDAKAVETEYNLSWLGTVTQRLDRMGNEWLEKLGTKASEAEQTAPPGLAEGLQLVAALTSEEGAEAFGKGFLRWANEFTEQRWFQDLTAALVGSQEDTNLIYRQVNTMKSNIAQTRSLFTVTLPAQLKMLFPEGFDGWNHLFTHVGRLDVGVLGTSAAEMFADDIARQRAIAALKSKLPNHWDAANLAHYMVHGRIVDGSPHPLLRNAQAIADDLNNPGSKRRKASESLIADVDQLVTLMAIDMMAQSDRARITGYFTQHPQAMNNLVGMLQKVNEEDLKQYNNDYRYTYWKGNLPLSTDPRTSVVLADSVKGAQLEALGYTRGKAYRTAPNDPNRSLAYYTRNFAPPPTFTQGVLATVQQTAMGINYTTAATISPEVGTIITNPTLVSRITLNQGRNSNLVPIFNFDGDIVGYERLLDRAYVQEQTKSNNTLLHIAIGAKLGRILEERLADKFNKEAITLLTTQWELGVKNGEQNQYEDVSSSTDKQIARAWEVVPADTKKALQDAFEGPVMIRKDLVANTLGYHKAGVDDIFTGNASLSLETRRAMFGLAQLIAGPSAAKYLYAAELAIKEGVATAKDWIIVRSLSVAINNAMASMNLVMANGVPFKELVKSYREGLRDIQAYQRLQKETIELSVKIAGATGVEKERLRTIQVGKQEAIEKLAIYPLIEAGELSDLPEGLEDTPQHSYAGDFAAWMNNHLKKIHPKTPMIVANALIAKDTAFHDGLSKAIQAGDFLGKWAVYKHMVKSGKSVEEARDTVRDEFISYTTNPGRFRGAMEDFGLIWWSQFTLRMQKVLLRRFRKNPFSFFASTVTGAITGADGPDDAALWERGWDSSTGLDNVVNAPSAHIWAKVF